MGPSAPLGPLISLIQVFLHLSVLGLCGHRFPVTHGLASHSDIADHDIIFVNIAVVVAVIVVVVIA
jgi:hypothetical protein